MAKIATLYRDWLRSFKLEKSELFELHRGEGGGKDINWSAQNAKKREEQSKWKKDLSLTKKLNFYHFLNGMPEKDMLFVSCIKE